MKTDWFGITIVALLILTPIAVILAVKNDTQQQGIVTSTSITYEHQEESITYTQSIQGIHEFHNNTFIPKSYFLIIQDKNKKDQISKIKVTQEKFYNTKIGDDYP